MTTEQKIQTWLKSQDKSFQDGLSLLSTYKSKKNLLRILTVRGKSPRSMRTLIYELTRLTKGTTTPVVIKKPVQFAKAIAPAKQQKKNPRLTERIGNPDQDPILHELYIHRNNLIKLSSSLKPQLEYLNKEERKQIAFRIIDTDIQKTELNRKIEFYEKFGMLPPDAKPTEINESDPVAIKMRIDNMRSRISRDKKSLAAAQTLVTKTKWEEDLAKHQTELDYLLKIFNR